jgi:hypothetical protein
MVIHQPNYIFRRLLGLLLILSAALWIMPTHAALHARVDRNQVELSQSFNLTLQGDEDGNLDLSPLQHDFEIVGQSKSNSFQLINGTASRNVVWQLTLIAKREGALRIPVISLNGQSSQPIALTVTDNGQRQQGQQGRQGRQGQQQEQGNAVFLETGASPQSAYVQQRVIVTVRLYRAVNLGNGSSLSEPKFPKMDGVLERLGQDRNFSEQRNGQDYAVIERRYAVYPQKSGQFASEPIQFNGEIIEQQGGFFQFDPFNQRGRRVRLLAKPIILTVKPIPAQAHANPWLPAKSLSLSEQWSQEPPTLTVGEPITRTLTITADGLHASQLPTLGTDTQDGLKLYPDQPVLTNQDETAGAPAAREQKTVMVANRAGALIFPPIAVTWWNLDTNREEVVTLPGRTVMVQAADSNAQGQPAQAAQHAQAAGASATPQAVVDPAAQAGDAVAAPKRLADWLPWLLVLLLAVAWCVTLLLWQRSRRALRGAKKDMPDAQPETHKQVEAGIRQACQANQSALVRTQLLAWAKLCWPQQPPNSLIALARMMQAGADGQPSALADAILLLDRTLYAGIESDWQGDLFWQLFQSQCSGKKKADKAGQASLAPLYQP